MSEKDFAKEFVGQKIVAVRPMNGAELESEGWRPEELCTCVVLEDGTKFYPSCDTEGNHPGEFFLTDPDGGQFGLKFSTVPTKSTPA